MQSFPVVHSPQAGNRTCQRAILVALLCPGALAASAYADDGPIVIGRSDAARPQILLNAPQGLLTGKECIELLPGDGIFAGLFVEDEPSFQTLLADDPAEGMFRLLPGAEIALRRLSFDEGFRIFEPVEFREILSGDNVFFVFPRDAEGDFNTHLIGGSDREGLVSATFQLYDMTGQHDDSEPFTICFQTIPAPSSLLLPALGLVFAQCRTRRNR